jgi:dCMP deaminase
MGIKKVVYLNSYAAYKGHGVEEGLDFLLRFGVEVCQYKPQSITA